jgi:hypothetical protein
MVMQMLVNSIRQYEDIIYFKKYKDIKEKNKVKKIITQLRQQLSEAANS